jgi:hypothetical protein
MIKAAEKPAKEGKVAMIKLPKAKRPDVTPKAFFSLNLEYRPDIAKTTTLVIPNKVKRSPISSGLKPTEFA